MLKICSTIVISTFAAILMAEAPIIVFNPLSVEASCADGQMINDVVMAELSCLNGVKMVDRQELNKILQEKSLQQNGMLESSSATQVSSLLGADFFVSGSIRIQDKKMTIFAKTLSVKDGTVKIKYATENAPFDPVKIGRNTAEQLALLLKDQKNTAEKSNDILPLLLPDKIRPAVVVVLPELHIARANIIDPAAENALTQVLLQQKFKVLQLPETVATGKSGSWANFIGDKSNLMKLAKNIKADYIIYGEAIAEGATVFGNFRTARARVEIKVIRANDGTICFADSVYAGAADTAEIIAGKRAIQIAATGLAPKVVDAILKDKK